MNACLRLLPPSLLSCDFCGYFHLRCFNATFLFNFGVEFIFCLRMSLAFVMCVYVCACTVAYIYIFLYFIADILFLLVCWWNFILRNVKSRCLIVILKTIFSLLFMFIRMQVNPYEVRLKYILAAKYLIVFIYALSHMLSMATLV